MPIAEQAQEPAETSTRVCEGCGPTMARNGTTYCCEACAQEAGRMIPKGMRTPLLAALCVGAGAWIGSRTLRREGETMARARTTAKQRRSKRVDHRRIHEVMTRDPACCLPSDPAQKAAGMMREHDTGIIPVIANDQDRTLVGVVTDRDLSLCLIAEGHDGNTPVQECMTPKPVSCHPEDPVEQAVQLMEDNQIRRIPVVDQENRIQGVVSMADVVRRSDVDEETTHEVLEKISEPTGEPSKPRAEAGLHYGSLRPTP